MRTMSSLFAAAALAACASDPPPTAYSAAHASAMSDAVATEAQDCFRMSQIRGHRKVDDSTLIVAVGSGTLYRWEMGGRCLAGTTSSDPLIMTPFAGTDVICRPIDLDLKVKMGPTASPCIIQSFVRLTPEEAAALPANQRP